MNEERKMKTFSELQEGVYDPNIFKAFFLAGGPGSGKSYVVTRTTKMFGMRVVNSDDVFEKLVKATGMNMDMRNYTAAQEKRRDELRDIAKRVTRAREKNYVEGRLGLIIDGTGKNYDKIEITDKGFVKITSGPTGLMMIKRSVFDKLKEDNPNLQIKFPEEKRKNINAEIMGAENTDENPSEDCLWNFFDTSFDDHLFKGEDIAFCELARKSGIQIYANIDSTTIHHGPYGYKGKFRDALEKVT